MVHTIATLCRQIKNYMSCCAAIRVQYHSLSFTGQQRFNAYNIWSRQVNLMVSQWDLSHGN